MSGYYGYSMSNNAYWAYLENKMPISKWTKKKIFEVIEENLQNEEFCEEYQIPEDVIEAMRKIPLRLLKKHALVSREWHHTSKFYNQTDFYEVNFSYIERLTPEDVQKWLVWEEEDKQRKLEWERFLAERSARSSEQQ